MNYRTVVPALVTLAALGGDLFAQPAEREPDTFLRKHVGFSQKDLDAVYSGTIMTIVLKTSEDSELAGATNVFYWAEEAFGLKPTTTLNHSVVYEPPDREAGLVVVKQLYASHYFQATVNLIALVRDDGPGAQEDARYLLRLDRGRADGLGGMFGGVKRGKIEGQLDRHIEAWLKSARQVFR